jgi:hypothetical protein
MSRTQHRLDKTQDINISLGTIFRVTSSGGNGDLHPNPTVETPKVDDLFGVYGQGTTGGELWIAEADHVFGENGESGGNNPICQRSSAG